MAKAAKRAPEPTNPTPRELNYITIEARDLLAEVQDTARRVAAQIENRYTKLDLLLTQAKTATARLEVLLAAQQDVGRPRPPCENGYAPVYTLADQGKPARIIGQELNMQPGEVELILALRAPTSSAK